MIEQRLGPFDFVLATGDDRTDEDVFAVLGPTVDSVYVGKGRTGARVALPSPEAMRIFLRALVNARENAWPARRAVVSAPGCHSESRSHRDEESA